MLWRLYVYSWSDIEYTSCTVGWQDPASPKTRWLYTAETILHQATEFVIHESVKRRKHVATVCMFVTCARGLSSSEVTSIRCIR